MKKKIIFTFLGLLLIFIISNYKIFLWNYFLIKANENYNNDIFTWALELYDESLKYLSWSNTFHNTWNAFYKLWENEVSLENKIDYYEKSLNSYEKVLKTDADNNTEENIDTKFNYEFVKKKLEELKEKEEEKKDDNSKEDNEKEDEDKIEENQEENEDKSDKNSEENENLSENNLTDEDKEYIKKKLTDIEVNNIEKYLEWLKNEEESNRKYYKAYNIKKSSPFTEEKDW